MPETMNIQLGIKVKGEHCADLKKKSTCQLSLFAVLKYKSWKLDFYSVSIRNFTEMNCWTTFYIIWCTIFDQKKLRDCNGLMSNKILQLQYSIDPNTPSENVSIESTNRKVSYLKQRSV